MRKYIWKKNSGDHHTTEDEDATISNDPTFASADQLEGWPAGCRLPAAEPQWTKELTAGPDFQEQQQERPGKFQIKKLTLLVWWYEFMRIYF